MINHAQRIADGLQIIQAIIETDPAVTMTTDQIAVGHRGSAWKDVATTERLFRLGWYVDGATDRWTYKIE